jgi:hypothetical protein
MPLPPVVSREEWLVARKEPLVRTPPRQAGPQGGRLDPVAAKDFPHGRRRDFDAHPWPVPPGPAGNPGQVL